VQGWEEGQDDRDGKDGNVKKKPNGRERKKKEGGNDRQSGGQWITRSFVEQGHTLAKLSSESLGVMGI
jgi:hypothetical protein